MADANYILDANVFIHAFQGYYAFDLVPKFWDRLKHHSKVRAKSVDKIQDELTDREDDLSKWVITCPEMFLPSGESAVVAVYGQLMDWAQNQTRFIGAAKSEFARCADGWLIAYAKVHNYTVVSHEAPAPKSVKVVKIPDVCQAFGVPIANTYQMLRGLGERL